MPEATYTKNMRDGTLRIYSGADEYTVTNTDGVISANIPGPTVSLYLDRGKITTPPQVRYNEDQPCSGSFTAQFRDVTDDSYVTVGEFVLKSGLFASGWSSTHPDACAPKLVTLEWKVDACGDGDDHLMVWPYCHITGAVAAGDPNQWTLNWTSYVLYPTVT